MKKLLSVLTIVLMITILATGCKSGSGASSTNNTAANDYVATVGNKKISTDEFKYFLASAKMSIEQQAGVSDAQSSQSFWAGNIGDQSAQDYAKNMAMQNSQAFEILLDKAKAAGITSTQQDVDTLNTQIDDYVKTLGDGTAGAQAYEKQYGISVDQAKAINPNMVLVQKYVDQEITNAKFTDAEVKKYYDDNKQKYQEVTVRQVLFLTEDASTGQPLPQAQQDAAKKKAEDIYNKVKKGADIAALAKQYSEDPGSKDNGGEYTFARGQMVQEFEDWSFKAKVGDVGLVKTQYGYHVIKLIKILGFSDVEAQVKQDMAQQKYSDDITQWEKDPQYKLNINQSVYSGIKVS